MSVDYPEMYQEILNRGEYIEPGSITATGECGENGDNVTYMICNGGLLIISGKGSMKDYAHNDIYISYEDGGSHQFHFPNEVFSPFYANTEIKRVIIKDGVDKIGSLTFDGCKNLETIEIPDSVNYIGMAAFYHCEKLTKVRIPYGITSIDMWTFLKCTNIQEIIIPETVVKIYEGAFEFCEKLVKINLPPKLKEITFETFYGCKSLTIIKIPSAVKTIETKAFAYCTSLLSLYIPLSVKKIGTNAFRGCTNLQSIDSFGVVNSIDSYAFADCRSLSSIDDLPSSLHEIPEGMFQNTGFREIVIPYTVQKIGAEAFKNCNKLETLKMEYGVSEIDSKAFANCVRLKEITIPGSVTDIGDKVFYGCISLNNVNLPYIFSYSSIGNNVFYGCSSLKNITIPKNCLQTWKNIFTNYNNIENITLHDGTYSIPDTAFKDCEHLVSINIPDSVWGIGSSAFENCYSLTDINLPESVQEIGSRAFENCYSLTDINLPNSIREINEYTFSNCKNLKNVNIPDTVRFIYRDAFYSCESLESIDIPGSVSSIGYEAFAKCKNLVNVNMSSGISIIDGFAFWGTGIEQIDLPESLLTLKECAFGDCSNLKNATIPSSVTHMECGIFVRDTALEKVNLLYRYEIPWDAFLFSDYCTDILTIYGQYGSAAEKYAEKLGIKFVESMVSIARIPETCTADGKKGYYYSNYYNKYYEDSDAKKEIESPDTWGIIPAKGHCYDKLTWSWQIQNHTYSAGLEIACSQCGIVKENGVFDANVTSQKQTDGSVKYTAKVVADGISYSDTKVVYPLTNISNIFNSEIFIGDNIQIDCMGYGGSGSYEYAVYYKKVNSSEWTEYQPYSSNKYINIPVSEKSAYNVRIKVRDEFGSIAEKNVIVNVNIGTLSNDSQMPYGTSGTSGSMFHIDLICYNSGVGKLQYAAYYKKVSDSVWTEIQSYGDNSSIDFCLLETGFYDICTVVKDSQNTVAKKYFSVRVYETALENCSEIMNTNISLGDTVGIDARANFGTGEYTYSVYYKKIPDTNWKQAQDYSENSYIEITPTESGQYTIRVNVKDGSGKIATKYLNCDVEQTQNILTCNAWIENTEIALDEVFNIHAEAFGGQGEYQYAVSYKKISEAQWTVYQNFSENTDISIIPDEMTDYNICVKVKDANGSVAEQYFQVSVIWKTRPSSESVLWASMDISSKTVTVGKWVNIYIYTGGGSGEYEYAVYYKPVSESQWTECKGYDEINNASIFLQEENAYHVWAKVRDSAGNIYERYDIVRCVLEQTDLVCCASASNIVGEGEPFYIHTWTYHEHGKLQYAVSYKKMTDSEWIVYQNFKDCGEISFTPTEAAMYDICIQAKDEDDRTAKTYLMVNVIHIDPSDNKLEIQSDINPVELSPGECVNINMNGYGGNGSYEYAVYYKTIDSNEWTEYKAYSNENYTQLWLQNEGTYNVCTKVRDESANEVSYYSTITVKIPPIKNNSHMDMYQTSLPLGNTFCIYVSANGGTGNYQYSAYYKRDSENEWSEISVQTDAYLNRTVEFCPNDEGLYEICIAVQDSMNNIAKKYFSVESIIIPLTGNSSISSYSVSLGEGVNINAGCYGGKGDIQIAAYYRKIPESDWKTIQDYSSNSFIPFIPQESGQYNIRVNIKDSLGTVTEEYFNTEVFGQLNEPLSFHVEITDTDIPLGGTVNIHAEITDDNGQYAVMYKKIMDTDWTTYQNFTSDNDISFVPDNTALYDICVQSKDSNGNIYEKYFSINVYNTISYIGFNGDKSTIAVYPETFTAESFSLPSTPYLDGYDFKGWTVNNTAYKNADYVIDAVVSLIKDCVSVEIKPVYEKKNETYMVHVINGTLTDGSTTHTFHPSEQLFVTADDRSSESKIFDHWTVSYDNGNMTDVSYSQTYAFRMPTKNITLKAVYVDTPEEVSVQKGTAYIESISKPADNKIAFTAISSVPEGSEMLRAGIVACKEIDLDDEHKTPSIDYARFKRYDDTTCRNYTTFKYTWTKGNVADETWCVCAYLLYKDTDGNEQTIYGDMVKSKLSDFNA